MQKKILYKKLRKDIIQIFQIQKFKTKCHIVKQLVILKIFDDLKDYIFTICIYCK